MAEQLGNSAVVRISTDGGSNYTAVGEVKDSNADGAQDLHDATSNDDALWKVDVKGHKKITLTFTCNYDEADAGQVALFTAYYAGSDFLIQYRPRGTTSGYKQLSGAFNFTTAPITAPTQGVMESAFSLESNGTITYSNQT